MLTLILVCAFSQPPQAPPLESRVASLESRMAALEAKCQYMNAPVASSQSAVVPQLITINGRQYYQTCTSAGCTLSPVTYQQSTPVMFETSFGQPVFYGGNCANGNCTTNSYSYPMRRGLFGRWR